MAESAIITGASGGLGQAIAHRLESENLDVMAPGKPDLDVTNEDQIQKYFDPITNLELLVCNAGITVDRSLTRMSESDWDEVIRVNLKGAFLCARQASKKMMKNRIGHIIFISSFSALYPSAGQANYAAAKAGLLGLMKSLARELGSRNIRVNAILPGFLETNMTSNLPEVIKDKVKDRHVLGHFNTPENVAEFIVCLHQKMIHTSGQIFNLDSRLV